MATTTVTEITRFTISFETTIDPCPVPPELVTFDGITQSVFHFTETDSGTKLIINGRTRLSGRGDSGTRYQAADHFVLSILSSSGTGADQVINVQNSVVVSSSGSPNFVGHLLFRFTITPDGDIEGVLDDFRGDCVPEEEL